MNVVGDELEQNDATPLYFSSYFADFRYYRRFYGGGGGGGGGISQSNRVLSAVFISLVTPAVLMQRELTNLHITTGQTRGQAVRERMVL